jgi:hypothetical protein
MSGFVVTSLRHAAYDARTLYEDLYYARREAESRIGEQFELWADHASWATMAANQLRSVVFGNRPRPWSMQRATRHAVCRCRGRNHRLKLLKLGVRVVTSGRRVHFAIASSCPSQHESLGKVESTSTGFFNSYNARPNPLA